VHCCEYFEHIASTINKTIDICGVDSGGIGGSREVDELRSRISKRSSGFGGRLQINGIR
jgi:hypothetical protein